MILEKFKDLIVEDDGTEFQMYFLREGEDRLRLGDVFIQKNEKSTLEYDISIFPRNLVLKLDGESWEDLEKDALNKLIEIDQKMKFVWLR